MSKHLNTAVVLVCFLTLSSCIPSSRIKRSPMRLCGERLLEALMLVCNGNFYGPGQGNSISRRETAEENSVDLSSGSGSYSQLSRRQIDGVVNECCINSCTLLDLAAYCSE